MPRRLRPLWILLVLILLPGCKSISISEITGKSSFGPEFRNFGDGTSDIRYTAIQGFDLKLSNGWTTGVSYQRRDVDDGGGDNENLVLFEIGYPIWKASKKSEKTANQLRLHKLGNELHELSGELAAAENQAQTEALP